MKVIILAAGQGTRLRPLTANVPKCMVKVNGKPIIDYQLEVMLRAGIKPSDIVVVAGYQSQAIKEKFAYTEIQIVENLDYMSTNMVYSLMQAREFFADDVIISYGDIIYGDDVFRKILDTKHEAAVIIDDGWQSYWEARGENPLEDAETLKYTPDDVLTEIGQKTDDLAEIMSQYIGLMRFRGKGLAELLEVVAEAQRRSERGQPLWRTSRTYQAMYMTDLLQGLIDSGSVLYGEHIQRGWYEVDNYSDLELAQKNMAKAYWITGLSGAGKSTISKIFYEKLRERMPNTVFLDGDALRAAVAADLGYSTEDRKECARRYGRLMKVLQEQGLNVICATICMYDEARAWNRANINNYVEVYVKVDLEVLQKRDQKNLYSKQDQSLAGVSISVEEPKTPDLVLMNNGDVSPEEQAAKLMQIAEKL